MNTRTTTGPKIPVARAAAIASLIAEFRRNDGLARENARWALVRMGKAAVGSLIDALLDFDERVRWEAAKALSEMREPAAVPAFVKALDDEQGDVRWVAARGLVKLGRLALVPMLQALMSHGDSPRLRWGAQYVLRRMRGRDFNGLLNPVLAALEDVEPSVEVPLAARIALAKLRAYRRVA